MKGLIRLVEECKAELDSIGIEHGNVRNWKINFRANCRWGQCKLVDKNTFDFNISYRLLRDIVEDMAIKSTIIHELLHTVNGCTGHKDYGNYLLQK